MLGIYSDTSITASSSSSSDNPMQGPVAGVVDCRGRVYRYHYTIFLQSIYHQSTGLLTGLLVCWSPVACRLSPLLSVRQMACPVPARPLQTHSCVAHFPCRAAAVGGPDPGRASPGLSLSWFVQIRSQRGPHAGGHWQSNTTPVTHRGAIAIAGTLSVIDVSSTALSCLSTCIACMRAPDQSPG